GGFKGRPYTIEAMKRWNVLALVSLAACGGNTQGGLSNAPGINRPANPDDMGHDVISNGPEACRPTPEHPNGPRLPARPEAGSSAKPGGSARRPPPQR